MTFKIVNMLCPECLQNKFGKRPALSNYNTRNMKILHAQKLKLEHTKTAFCTQLRTLGISYHSPLEMARPLHKRVEISPIELEDTIVAPNLHKSMEEQQQNTSCNTFVIFFVVQ